MYDLLLYNARVFSMSDEDHEEAQWGAKAGINNSERNVVGIISGKIELLESIHNIADLKHLINNSRHSIDVKNKWLTPGLIDCHTHLVFAGDRSHEFAARLNGQSYAEITKLGGGINYTVNCTQQASFEELLTLAKARIDKMRANGVTTVEIKSGYGLSLESEMKILRVAAELAATNHINIQKTFLGAHVVPNNFKGQSNSAENYISYLINTVLPQLYENNLVDAVDGFCEGIAFTPAQLQPLYTKAKEYGLLIKGHTEQLSNIGGGELICAFGGSSCDHLEYADQNLVKLMQNSNTAAVLLPGAYYYLREKQQPPIALLREYKIPIAIATDFNPGTSPILSLVTVMNMACVLFNLTMKEVWQGVTINAAKALKLEHKLGSIELNKQADIIIWDFNHPYDLCYYLGDNFVNTVIHKGQIVQH